MTTDSRDSKSSPTSTPSYIAYLKEHLSASSFTETIVDIDSTNETTPLLNQGDESCDDAGGEFKIKSVDKRPDFWHSLFNIVNLLIGVGLLSLPYVLKTSGWIIGLTLITSYALITNYTAKTLAKCLTKTNSEDYIHLAYTTFGYPGRLLLSVILIIELFASTVAFNVLIGDTLNALVPGVDKNWLLVVVFCLILLPSSWTDNLKILGYGSILGLMGSIFLLVILFYNGLNKFEKPGSLIEVQDTRLWPENWLEVPVNFGAIIFCFSGHAVFPDVYRQMKKPQQYNRLINVTYTFCTLWFLVIACTGYLMFGDFTLEELTLNLSQEPTYSPILNQILLIIMIILPITKYSLLLNPVSRCFEKLLIEPYLFPSSSALSSSSASLSLSHSASSTATTPSSLSPSTASTRFVYLMLRTLLRSVISLSTLVIAILFPSFHSVIGFIGALLSFFLCFVAPAACYLRCFGDELKWKEWCLNWGILWLGIVSGVAGCIGPFIV